MAMQLSAHPMQLSAHPGGVHAPAAVVGAGPSYHASQIRSQSPQMPTLVPVGKLCSLSVIGATVGFARAVHRRVKPQPVVRKAHPVPLPITINTAQTLGQTLDEQMQDAFSALDIGGLSLYLDTADTAEWDRLLPLGFFSGVTTNPVLLQRAGVPCTIESMRGLLAKALEYPIQEIMFQAWGEDHDALYNVGREISQLDPRRVVVKMPLTADGIRAAGRLRENNVRVCMTTCYAAKQALIAACLGAEFISPYLGRMMEKGMAGVDECIRMQEIVNGRSMTRIFVASIRNVDVLVELARKGVSTFTLPPQIVDELVELDYTTAHAKELHEAACSSADSSKKKKPVASKKKPKQVDVVDELQHDQKHA